MKASSGILKYLGLTVTTTEFAICGRTEDGQEAFAAVPMQGMEKWLGQPACHLQYLFTMMQSALKQLLENGWEIASKGAFSVAVRQHDLVLVGHNGELLSPTLTWQCRVAEKQVEQLRKQGAESIVGRIETRFILPKLMWLLAEMPALMEKIRYVMTTGDYLMWKLTGELKLSTSDALSNGLLYQGSKQLATGVLEKAGLDPDWFPPVIQSGDLVDGVAWPNGESEALDWCRNQLAYWQGDAGLGDNQAAAMGNGLDSQTIVVSAGTSGTITRLWNLFEDTLAGQAVQFEYYSKWRMLLLMLADCGAWYNRFREQFAMGISHSDLNVMAASACLGHFGRVRLRPWDGGWVEEYPISWEGLPTAEKIASTQASIAFELALRVKLMLAEILSSNALPIQRIILTGGLSQSEFFQGAFQTALSQLGIKLPVLVIDPKSPAAFKPDARGAMMLAMLGAKVFPYPHLRNAIKALCPLRACAPALPADKFLPEFFQE